MTLATTANKSVTPQSNQAVLYDKLRSLTSVLPYSLSLLTDVLTC